MINGTISNPHYVDLEKTTVAFTLTTPEGVITKAELKVPENKARNVNPYWDNILDNFDIEQMRLQRNQQEIRKRKQAEFEATKAKAKLDNDKLVRLFNKKTKIFAMPFVASASDDTKSAIRRCSDELMLDFIYQDILKKYMVDNNFTHTQLLDYLDDLQEQSEANTTPQTEVTETTPSDENTTPA